MLNIVFLTLLTAVHRIIVFFFVSLIVFNALSQTKPRVIQFVKPLIGTSGSTVPAAMKHGEGTEKLANTIPAVGVPFGMTQWTPQTQRTEKKCLAPYYYKDSALTGFRGTHWLSGSCTQDYGSLTIMPVTGTLKTRVADYSVKFSHKEETSAPDYYRLKINQLSVTAEITALARSSIFRFTMDKEDSLFILVMPNSDKGKGFVKVDKAKNEITGFNPAHRIYQGWGKPAGFSGYFVIKFERTPGKKGTFDGTEIFLKDTLANKNDIGAFVGFKLKKGEQLKLKIGTSFTSIENARLNLDSEIATWDFDNVRRKSAFEWEKYLTKIMVEGGSVKDKEIFYTALYHSAQHPRLFNDVDGSYPEFGQSYQIAKIEKGNYYDDFSMWDIYRAQLPLMEILEPARVNDFVTSLIIKGKQGGWLPIFPCWNSYTGAMIGDHAISVIASAYLKKITNADISEGYELMRKNAFISPTQAEYKNGMGRRALHSYLKFGYIPLEDSVKDAFHQREQVSRTMEYAYDDYALALIAEDLKKEEDYQELLKRSKNYQNVFDPSTGFVRGKFSDGSWVSPFDPDQKVSFITEGTPRQYTFYAPHDIQGLTTLMGGENKFEEAVDFIFEKGEYWHGNEPGHHIPFLYHYTQSPWKTQKEVRRILEEEYDNTPGGLSGNDDAGQMSAWYVFAAIGFYPVNPVSSEYALFSPIFEKVKIKATGKAVTEIALKKNTPNARYIKEIKLNGIALNRNFIQYSDLIKGGKIEIELVERQE